MSPPERPRRRRHTAWYAVALTAAVCAATALVAIPSASGSGIALPPAQFYIPTDTALAKWVGNAPADAAHPEYSFGSQITSQPQGIWLSDWNALASTVYTYARTVVTAAKIQNRIAAFVPYMIPFRDCANASAGGAPDLTSYSAWIDQLADGIRDGLTAAGRSSPRGMVYVLLEPDAVALQKGDSGCVDKDGKLLADPNFDIAARNAALTNAVVALTRAGCDQGCDGLNTHVRVFLDTGHSKWYGSNLNTMANRLIAAGIGRAWGFYSNASNYQPTANEVTYGQNLNKVLAAKGIAPKAHIIDTSRNGAPITAGTTGWPDWCDPSEARLGTPSTLAADDGTTHLWIKPPGETDGCYGGSDTKKFPAHNRDGRGVPDDALPAGSLSTDQACHLMTGSTVRCDVDFALAPPVPTGLRVSQAVRQMDGFETDGLLLEWAPSHGACAYQIGRQLPGRTGFSSVAMAGTGDKAPPSSVWLTGSAVGQGSPVRYAVRARHCGTNPLYSRYSAAVATSVF
jgi:hypothetical protein